MHEEESNMLSVKKKDYGRNLRAPERRRKIKG